MDEFHCRVHISRIEQHITRCAQHTVWLTHVQNSPCETCSAEGQVHNAWLVWVIIYYIWIPYTSLRTKSVGGQKLILGGKKHRGSLKWIVSSSQCLQIHAQFDLVPVEFDLVPVDFCKGSDDVITVTHLVFTAAYLTPTQCSGSNQTTRTVTTDGTT